METTKRLLLAYLYGMTNICGGNFKIKANKENNIEQTWANVGSSLNRTFKRYENETSKTSKQTTIKAD